MQACVRNNVLYLDEFIPALCIISEEKDLLLIIPHRSGLMSSSIMGKKSFGHYNTVTTSGLWHLHRINQSQADFISFTRSSPEVPKMLQMKIYQCPATVKPTRH